MGAKAYSTVEDCALSVVGNSPSFVGWCDDTRASQRAWGDLACLAIASVMVDALYLVYELMEGRMVLHAPAGRQDAKYLTRLHYKGRSHAHITTPFTFALRRGLLLRPSHQLLLRHAPLLRPSWGCPHRSLRRSRRRLHQSLRPSRTVLPAWPSCDHLRYARYPRLSPLPPTEPARRAAATRKGSPARARAQHISHEDI